ncbi:MAG: HlyD family efflux transporter periplasmic adaptor subunit [Oscillochloris sp.]|nr:HlyD family efflux transporter periplasmic adaptor subunit [Oscillochloris sp.]
MSTISTTPEQRRIGRLGNRRKRRFSPWLVVPLALILAGGGYVAWQQSNSSATTTATTSTATVSRGTLSVSVSGSGTVAATTSRALGFAVSGTVSEVLVAVGDTVSAGQPIARINTSDLELALRQAAANLKSAEAQVAAANGEGATPEELAAAESQLASAQAQYSQTVNGTTTASEVAGARAQLASAQAQLDDLLDGATAADLASARDAVTQAERNLESQRSSLAAAKTNAESQVTTAANNLRDVQDAYSTIYWQNREQERLPGDLPQSAIDEEAAALRAVENAEQSLHQAKLAYEQAQQDEISGIQQAEADLAGARRDLATVQDGATAAEIASARASVASAQTNLNSLLEGATAEERTIAQASLDQARINVAQLTAPSSAASIASADASLAQAQVALAQAQQDLADATLLAPFDGVVSEVLVNVGDTAGSTTTITILDPSDLYVELSLSESDVAGVVVGQVVDLTFDALPDATISGMVTAIAPVATVTSNVATYPVRVSFEPGDLPIKVGMTAGGTIITETHADALIVPSRAVQTLGDASVVQVRQGDGRPAVPVRVETGLTSDGQTEILSCVDTGDLCLQEGDNGWW